MQPEQPDLPVRLVRWDLLAVLDRLACLVGLELPEPSVLLEPKVSAEVAVRMV